MCIAINPYNFAIPWYKEDQMPMYLNTESNTASDLLPHIWMTAKDAYMNMKLEQRNQCLVVTGESGAGKTEAVKSVMRFLTSLSGGNLTSPGEIAGKLLQANPVMEAFGNAKTLRNDNSSRFGKFVKIYFSQNGGKLVGAHTTKYLLEKSRVLSAAEGERIYHSFYLLAKGKDARKYGLDRPLNEYAPLVKGNCMDIAGVNDAADYEQCCKAMDDIGVLAAEKEGIWRLLASILMFQQVVFEAEGEGSRIAAPSEICFKKVAGALEVESADLARELTSTRTTARNEVITRHHSLAVAFETRDALCKALYDWIFDWLVNKLNDSLSTPEICSGCFFIGLLDIFGFENFPCNSFEQLCINLTNETLQNHYNSFVFHHDLEDCRNEGIDIPSAEGNIPDNTVCVNLITGKLGVLALLNEECKLARGTDETFMAKLDEAQNKCPCFTKKRIGRAFQIKHYAQEVTYDADGFRGKNLDSLKEGIQALLSKSKSSFLRALCPSLPQPADSRKPAARTVASYFTDQLKSLMATIEATNPSWIRCIKPHPAKQARMWDGCSIVHQLSTAGVLETVRIRKTTFPIRIPKSAFASKFGILGRGGFGKGADSRIEAVLDHFKFTPQDCQIGTTRVFMLNGPYQTLEEESQRNSIGFAKNLQAWVRSYLTRLVQSELELQETKRFLKRTMRGVLLGQARGRKRIIRSWQRETLHLLPGLEDSVRITLTGMERTSRDDVYRAIRELIVEYQKYLRSLAVAMQREEVDLREKVIFTESAWRRYFQDVWNVEIQIVRAIEAITERFMLSCEALWSEEHSEFVLIVDLSLESFQEARRIDEKRFFAFLEVLKRQRQAAQAEGVLLEQDMINARRERDLLNRKFDGRHVGSPNVQQLAENAETTTERIHRRKLDACSRSLSPSSTDGTEQMSDAIAARWSPTESYPYLSSRRSLRSASPESTSPVFTSRSSPPPLLPSPNRSTASPTGSWIYPGLSRRPGISRKPFT
eukprot:NODE_132_length_3113_cov_22.736945_g122_i0.p1 GENE.NODE_132_length_3113_cov_22.736945_g122_i0~~NODE_132_length_3113_cov_22.736945_g122_i0.p1  ORF type:complete len:990 (-),score=170.41 NODE_132_length_3113_cov_22.736945_g122_i0:110-3079(-)